MHARRVEDRHVTSLAMSAESRAAVERLKETAGLSSLSAVFQRALTAYTEIVELQQSGGSVIFRREDGSEERVRFV